MQVGFNTTPLTTIPSTSRSTANQRQQQARAEDSYTRNAASAPIIDAEYVELEKSARARFTQERRDIDLSLNPQIERPASTDQSSPAQKALNAKFQTAPSKAPRPGSYVNIYA